MKICHLIFVLVKFMLLAAKEKQIEINERRGNNSAECIEGKNPCRSLAYAVNYTNGSVVYNLTSAIISIDSVIEFNHHYGGVTINGGNYYQNTTIVCSCNNYSNCGLMFIESENITLSNFEITGCSVQTLTISKSNETLYNVSFLSGIVFHSCKNLATHRLSSNSNTGFGLLIINSGGDIELFESNFTSNSPGVLGYSHGGGGLMILSSACTLAPWQRECKTEMQRTYPGKYSIVHCLFRSNTQNTKVHLYHLSYGGGLNIFLSWEANNNSFIIAECTFDNNTSIGGGGLAINIQKTASDNVFSILDSNFTNNDGSYDYFGGGGGLKISVNSEKDSIDNRINVHCCKFHSNNATYGGGTAVQAGKSSNTANNVSFYECHWTKNKAPVSAAVDISPDVRSQDAYNFNTRVSFENCKIKKNLLKSTIPHQTFRGKGVFLVTRLEVTFWGNISFENNNHTALYLQSSYITVKHSANVLFFNNSGSYGGAIRTSGFSGIHYENNTTFNFTNNTASFEGGAIYSRNSDQHLPFSSHTCFFKPVESMSENVNFYFTNNTAISGYGNVIYLVSLHACRMACEEQNENENWDPFNNSNSCLGNFTFNDGHYKTYDVTTDVYRLSIHWNKSKSKPYVLYAIPGHLVHIPLRTHDDYERPITNVTAFYANLDVQHINASIDIGTRIISNNHIKMYGVPGTSGNISVTPIGSRGAFLNVHFKLTQCPPGYVWEKQRQSCICSALSNEGYWGIIGCDDNKTLGLLSPGFWVGYIIDNNGEQEKESEKTLFTSACPLNYCKPFNESFGFGGIFRELISQPKKKVLEEQICAKNRYGTLCGQCVNGTSVFYNSNSYQCREEKLCKYGLLLYAIADLLPVTIMFVLLLASNVSLTSGTAYSVIFMIQQFHILEITGRGAIQFKHYGFILKGANFVYSTINMEFFNIDSLSFCLWSGAQTLDILAMKYVSVLFAMSLVFLFFVFMNKCSSFCKKYRCKSRYSVVHGLTAFLVICYTITTRVTFSILNKGIAYGLGSRRTHAVVFLDGETRYFHGNHIKYAIPAIVFLVLIVIPPPLILLFDPILLKLEDKLCYLRQPWTKIRIKIKPLMDSFQNCFKDDMRWCAGLFFFYRSAILLQLLISQNIVHYYFLVEGSLILLLTAQSILQPFQHKRHNIIASLCFINLAITNYLTICIYNLVTTKGYAQYTIALQWIQVFFIYLPLLVGVAWVIRLFLIWITKRIFKGMNKSWGKLKDIEKDEASISLIFNRSIMSDYGSSESGGMRNDTYTGSMVQQRT